MKVAEAVARVRSEQIAHADEFVPALKHAIEAVHSNQPALIECAGTQNFRYSRY